MFSKKATKIDEIFRVEFMLSSKRQIDGEDFINFYGLLGKHELYLQRLYHFLDLEKGTFRIRVK